jgi:hypothetical protein
MTHLKPAESTIERRFNKPIRRQTLRNSQSISLDLPFQAETNSDPETMLDFRFGADESEQLENKSNAHIRQDDDLKSFVQSLHLTKRGPWIEPTPTRGKH